jgi:hypothetical protein
LNLPDVQFPKLETHLESDPLFGLQFLELKPLGRAVYLFFSIKISERNSLVSPSQLGLLGLEGFEPSSSLDSHSLYQLSYKPVFFKPSAGFKPAPFLLEARHSVQLSYEGMGIWARIKLATSGFARQRSVH